MHSKLISQRIRLIGLNEVPGESWIEGTGYSKNHLVLLSTVTLLLRLLSLYCLILKRNFE